MDMHAWYMSAATTATLAKGVGTDRRRLAYVEREDDSRVAILAFNVILFYSVESSGMESRMM